MVNDGPGEPCAVEETVEAVEAAAAAVGLGVLDEWEYERPEEVVAPGLGSIAAVVFAVAAAQYLEVVHQL